jgi:hypothetical protein
VYREQMDRCILLAGSLAACDTAASRASVSGSAPPTVASISSSVNTECGPAECEPPFTSVSELPAHNVKAWVLIITANGFSYAGQKDMLAFRVAETRAGDIPLPSNSPWKCRFDHAKILNGSSTHLVDREIRCSGDGWKTSVTTSGMYGDTLDGAALDLRYRASPSASGKVELILEPRDTSKRTDGTSLPELP